MLEDPDLLLGLWNSAAIDVAEAAPTAITQKSAAGATHNGSTANGGAKPDQANFQAVVPGGGDASSNGAVMTESAEEIAFRTQFDAFSVRYWAKLSSLLRVLTNNNRFVRDPTKSRKNLQKVGDAATAVADSDQSNGTAIVPVAPGCWFWEADWPAELKEMSRLDKTLMNMPMDGMLQDCIQCFLQCYHKEYIINGTIVVVFLELRLVSVYLFCLLKSMVDSTGGTIKSNRIWVENY